MTNFKECIICNKKYSPNSNVQKTCSKKCRKEKDKRVIKEYRKKNKEEIKIKKRLYDKKYRKENKKRLNKTSRKYYQKYKNTKIRDYRLRNKKKILLYNKEYYKRNKDKFREYFQKDKGKYRIRIRNYKKKFKIKTNARNYAKTHNQKNEKCSRCGSEENLEFHHTDYEKNKGLTLCRKCHKKEHLKFK